MKVPKPHHKKTEPNQTLIIGGITLAALLLVSLGYFFTIGPGKAYYISEVPKLEEYDLTKDASIVYQILPTEDKAVPIINFSTNKKTNNFTLSNYTFTFTWLEEGVYQVELTDPFKTLIALDVLEEGGESNFYLNNEDNETDLTLSLNEGELTIENQHYIQATKSKIILTNQSGDIYPLVIPLELGANISVRVNVTSSMTPDVSITIDGKPITFSENYSSNTTKVLDFNWTAPNESKAIPLQVTSNVGGLKTKANYLLAVGDAAYAYTDTGFPTITLNYYNKSAGKATLNVAFSGVAGLQPFALPCTLDNDSTEVHFNASVKRIYSYLNEEELGAKVWAPQLPSDVYVKNLVPFRGYFLELANTEPYTFTANCTIPVLTPTQTSAPPSFSSEQSLTLDVGWNLISLPGVVPLYLDDLTSSVWDMSDVSLYQCAQGYKCKEITDDKVLYPGRPYWIYTPEELELSYKEEEVK